MLKKVKILLGITGGIAAYKTCQLVRDIKKLEGEVKVVLTENGEKFVSPVTLGVLSENRIERTLFPEGRENEILHLDLSKWADIILICPATANIIGKTAGGIADDLLSSIILASAKPVVFAPAMNVNMFMNYIVQENIQKLKNKGYHFMGPEAGYLACHEEGAGRLIDTDHIIEYIKRIVGSKKKFQGKRILVTAGRTEEEIDPVRIITNRSSGKMGYAVARSAYYNGADVTLVSGPGSLPEPYGIEFHKTRSSDEMYTKVVELFKDCDVCIMTAAVLDFKPENRKKQKMKKGTKESLTVTFQRTPDILKTISQKKGKKILVGFSVETENEIENSLKKLKEKKLDLIIVNNPLPEDSGFETDTNKVWIINKKGDVEELPVLLKNEIAEIIMKKIESLM